MLNATASKEDEGISVSTKLFGVLILAFILVFVGVIILFVASASASASSGSFGVVIFIGPIPIVFGAGPDASWLILIGIVLAVVSIVLSVLFRKKRFLGY